MTLPMPLTYAQGALANLGRLRTKFGERDGNMAIIKAVRDGHIKSLFPSELDWDEEFKGVPTSNFIDIVARDLSEGIAPLPQLACTSGMMRTDADRNRASRKNQIGYDYWAKSNLQKWMYGAADSYVSAGFVPFYIEPNVDDSRPRVCVDPSEGSYYELDREGCTVVYGHVEWRTIDELSASFPKYENAIRKAEGEPDDSSGSTPLEVVRWVDRKTVTLFLPSRQGLILGSYEHKLTRHPVVIAERPGFNRKTPRGQFDDVVYVQVARAVMGLLQLKIASRAANAPMVVPDDVDEVPTGPDAIISSANAKDIHIPDLTVPQSVFAENATLDQELRTGSRYPDARTGAMNASVITGKGVEALLGTFDSQIKGDQDAFKAALEQITSLCFEMDETWWPNETKVVRGNTTAGSFEFKYTPKVEIDNRWDCTVTYGFATGLKPSQAIVSILQLAGAGFIAKKTAMTNLGGIFSIDPEQEEMEINTEAAREALKQGLFALVQSAGQIAAQGGDALPIIQLGVDTIKGVQNSKPIEAAIEEAFKTMQQAQQAKAEEAAAQAQEQAQGAPAGPGGPPAPGGGGDALPPDVAPGQAGMPPGGMATTADLVAGFRGNGSLPVNQMTIRRRVATGT